MKTLREEVPEIFELSAKSDIIASAFSDIASLKDLTLTSREDIRARARSIVPLVNEMNAAFASLVSEESGSDPQEVGG